MQPTLSRAVISDAICSPREATTTIMRLHNDYRKAHKRALDIELFVATTFGVATQRVEIAAYYDGNDALQLRQLDWVQDNVTKEV